MIRVSSALVCQGCNSISAMANHFFQLPQLSTVSFLGALAFLLILNPLGLATIRAQDTVTETADDHVALLLKLNKPVKPVEATDIQGLTDSFTKNGKRKALVVAFLDFRCPISNRTVPELNEMALKYNSLGVDFFGVVCDGVTGSELTNKSKAFKINFRLFHDPNHTIASNFRATVTPQVFLIDGKGNLRYFGSVNDQYANRTTRLNAPKTHHLAKALDQVLTGTGVEISSTETVGCPITRDRKPVLQAGVVTFHKHVEPLLQKHCQRCHHPDDVAPFSLMNFDEAFSWADDIREFVSSKKMPPWPITGGVPMKNDISLKPEEIATICKWVTEGCPKGDIQDAPKPVTFKSRDLWDDPNPPDLVLKIPATFHLAAKGEDHYRNIVFPLGNSEEKYLRKSQFIPGNKKIVHHSLTFYDGTGLVLDAQKRLGKSKPVGTGDEDYGPGYESGMGLGFIPNPSAVTRNQNNPGGGLGGWVPGAGAIELPTGTRQVLPPDSSIFLGIHYHRTGKPELDSDSRLAIWFDKEKPKTYSSGYVLDTTFRLSPKGVENFKATGTKVISNDCELYLIAPHMHGLGKELRVWHQPKDAKERKLILELKNWDFNWQSRYTLKEPIFMEKGSTLQLEAILDNSSRNPNNPSSPPKTVFLGENTTDEMAFAVIGTIRKDVPRGGSDFLIYLERLIEAEALKKLLGGK